VHKIETDQGILYRFQGVALPKGFLVSFKRSAFK